MENGTKVQKSKPMSIRIPMDLFNFLAQKAKEDGRYNENGKPMVGGYIVEKAIECFNSGWDNLRDFNPDGINLKTKSEVMAEMGWVHEESQRYRALCEVIESKSHNGLKFYTKEVDKLLTKRKQLTNV